MAYDGEMLIETSRVIEWENDGEEENIFDDKSFILEVQVQV